MVKEWPQKTDHRTPIVKISDPAMEWHEINLNDLLGCCLARVGPSPARLPEVGGQGDDDR